MSLFPKYLTRRKHYVGKRKLAEYKQEALQRVETNLTKIIDAYETYYKENFCNRNSIQFNFEKLRSRIRKAKLKKVKNCYGESDDDNVFISNAYSTRTVVVGTLIHEAMHYAVKFNSRYIGEKSEHEIMFMLGEKWVDCVDE